MDTSDITKRMKDYERRNQYYLQKRTPVIIRCDGRSFHTFVKGFKKPFDHVLMKTMQDTMKYLCENIQECVLGYTESDEITLVLIDYENFNTDSFFNYRTDKLCSIAASMATLAFNKFFRDNVESWWTTPFVGITKECQDRESLYHAYQKALDKGAMFDARCFNIPKEEVTNCVYWRQLDASRNSIQAVGQANFSNKELQNKTCSEIQDMLMLQKGVNWNALSVPEKRGTCCVKNKVIVSRHGELETAYLRDPSKSEREWIIDNDIPIFKGEGRNYIEVLVDVGPK